MASPPNFIAANARAHNGNVRVDLASAPVAWGIGFVYSLSPDVADELADQLRDAATAARAHATPNTSEQSAESRSGG